MHSLPNTPHESFAWARPESASFNDAYEDVGFLHGHGHGASMSLRSNFALRIADFDAERIDLGDAAIASGIRTTLPRTKAGGAFEKLTLKQWDRILTPLFTPPNPSHQPPSHRPKSAQPPPRQRPSDSHPAPIERPKTSQPAPTQHPTISPPPHQLTLRKIHLNPAPQTPRFPL